MPTLDDLRLTSAELTHLVASARALEARAAEDGARQDNPHMRGIFEEARRVYGELAEKVERLAGMATS